MIEGWRGMLSLLHSVGVRSEGIDVYLYYLYYSRRLSRRLTAAARKLSCFCCWVELRFGKQAIHEMQWHGKALCMIDIPSVYCLLVRLMFGPSRLIASNFL